jgi:hypothetical protein
MIPPQIVRLNAFPSDLDFTGQGSLRTATVNSSVTVRAGDAGTIEVVMDLGNVGAARITFEDGGRTQTQTRSFTTNQTQDVPFTWFLRQPAGTPHATSITIEARARYLGGAFGIPQRKTIELDYPQPEAVVGAAMAAGAAVGVAAGRRVRALAAKRSAKKKASAKKKPAPSKKQAAKKAAAKKSSKKASPHK